MTVGKLTQPYRGRRGSPSVMELRFWTDATKTVGRDMTAISSTWLAELRANSTDTSAAGTWSIDHSAAAGSAGVPGVLTLSLDSDGVTALLGGRGERTFGWDLFALDTDTPIVTGTYIVDDAYTHPGSGASPSASTPLGIYDITVLGATTTNLTEVDVFSGPAGPAGPPGGVNSVDGRQGDISLSDIYQPVGSYLTPPANASGALTNDGAGVLTWVPLSGGASIGAGDI